METADFEWFDYQGAEEAEIRKIKQERSFFEKSFRFFSGLVFFLLGCSFVAAFVFRVFPNLEYNLYDYKLSELNNTLLKILISFRMIIFLLFILNWFLEKFNFRSYAAILQVTGKYIAIFVWMLFCLTKISPEFGYLKSYCCIIMIASLIFGMLSLLMIIFQNKLIETAMDAHMKETNTTEEILRTFKKFAYEDASVRRQNTNHEFSDIFSIDFSGVITTCATLDEGNKTEPYELKPPEISNIQDAIILARDVFTKAVPVGSKMNINDFRNIFETDEQFQRSLSFFDLSSEKDLCIRDFRNTVINLYHRRTLLSKSIYSKIQFSYVIERLLSIVCLLILVIVSFVIVGTDIKKLITLAISSAIVVNFAGSEIVKDMWKSIVFVISHQFDIGDDVVIDEKEMTVFNIGILASSFVLSNGGKIKISNSNLWNKLVTNMTKAPEKLLLFSFDLKPNISNEEINFIRKEISGYLNRRNFDLLDTFVFDISIPNHTSIELLKTAVIIKCKNYNTKSKRFLIRAEFSAFLKSVLEKIQYKNFN